MSKGLPRSLKRLYGEPEPQSRSIKSIRDQLGETDVVNVTGSVPSAVAAFVTAEEFGFDAARRTVLTITALPVEVIAITTANGVGGTLVYDFPKGFIQRIGTVSRLAMSVDAAKQDDFTDGAVAGDVGIGSLAPANADSLGTDSTDDDFATAVAFLMAAFVDPSIVCPPEAAANVDGSGTALNAFINVLVDAAEIDDGLTSEVLVSGTIEFNWSLIGDIV